MGGRSCQIWSDFGLIWHKKKQGRAPEMDPRQRLMMRKIVIWVEGEEMKREGVPFQIQDQKGRQEARLVKGKMFQLP